jgi:hypothetical protein
VFDHATDQGIKGTKIAGTPFAVVDVGGNFHVFAREK